MAAAGVAGTGSGKTVDIAVFGAKTKWGKELLDDIDADTGGVGVIAIQFTRIAKRTDLPPYAAAGFSFLLGGKAIKND